MTRRAPFPFISWLAVALGGGCSDDGTAGDEASASEPTWHDDIAPLFRTHCTGCHEEGGIAPFALDDYASAQPLAASIAVEVAARTTPPWGVDNSGRCT